MEIFQFFACFSCSLNKIAMYDKYFIRVNYEVFSYLSENPSQVGRGYVAITILDINDNAPEFAMEYETTVCENAQPGQVRRFASAPFMQFL